MTATSGWMAKKSITYLGLEPLTEQLGIPVMDRSHTDIACRGKAEIGTTGDEGVFFLKQVRAVFSGQYGILRLAAAGEGSSVELTCANNAQVMRFTTLYE